MQKTDQQLSIINHFWLKKEINYTKSHNTRSIMFEPRAIHCVIDKTFWEQSNTQCFRSDLWQLVSIHLVELSGPLAELGRSNDNYVQRLFNFKIKLFYGEHARTSSVKTSEGKKIVRFRTNLFRKQHDMTWKKLMARH